MCFVFIEIVLIYFFRKTIDIAIILYCELIACSPDFPFYRTIDLGSKGTDIRVQGLTLLLLTVTQEFMRQIDINEKRLVTVINREKICAF